MSDGDYDDHYEVWPENWPSWQLFVEMSGQWRVGGLEGRRYALDYTPLFLRMERLGLDAQAWESMFADIRLMERTVLEVVSKSNPS